jgi:hypothetical protein
MFGIGESDITKRLNTLEKKIDDAAVTASILDIYFQKKDPEYSKFDLENRLEIMKSKTGGDNTQYTDILKYVIYALIIIVLLYVIPKIMELEKNYNNMNEIINNILITQQRLTNPM